MKKIALLSALSLAVSSQLMAGGYKIPEQSVNGTALSAAYIANAKGADASYYNPAAMAFNEGGRALEADLSLIHLTSIKYDGALFDGKSQIENFLVPSFHYVSEDMGGWRYGFSATAPAGLSKRWEDQSAAAYAEEFTLQTLELNPTIGFQVNDKLAIGGGVRVVYSKGKVTSSDSARGVFPLGRDMEGDSFDFGYNLALHFNAADNLDLSATYRSKVELTVDGSADLTHSSSSTPKYSGGASVTVPIPAALNLAAAYTFDKTTIELVLERTYWSAYKELDFNYPTDISAIAVFGPSLAAAFDAPKTKNWRDSNTIRLGLTHEVNDRWTAMAGFAYDKTPVQKQYAGYELPDTDAKIYSLGARYKYNDQLTIGAAILYDDKKSLDLTGSGNTEAQTSLATGKFTNAAAYFATVGVQYNF